MPLFRALAKNMAPMTNADESPTNPGDSYLPVSLYSIYHRDYKRIEAASGDESRNKLNKSNGGQI